MERQQIFATGRPNAIEHIKLTIDEFDALNWFCKNTDENDKEGIRANNKDMKTLRNLRTKGLLKGNKYFRTTMDGREYIRRSFKFGYEVDGENLVELKKIDYSR